MPNAEWLIVAIVVLIAAYATWESFFADMFSEPEPGGSPCGGCEPSDAGCSGCSVAPTDRPVLPPHDEES